jgi:hypothetical protein
MYSENVHFWSLVDNIIYKFEFQQILCYGDIILNVALEDLQVCDFIISLGYFEL